MHVALLKLAIDMVTGVGHPGAGNKRPTLVDSDMTLENLQASVFVPFSHCYCSMAVFHVSALSWGHPHPAYTEWPSSHRDWSATAS